MDGGGVGVRVQVRSKSPRRPDCPNAKRGLFIILNKFLSYEISGFHVSNVNTTNISDITPCSLVSSEGHSASHFYTENGDNVFIQRVKK
jgi:hypothetical protein